MYQSILQFIEKDIIEVEKIMGKILTGEKDADDLSQEVVTRLNSLACRWISEMYEKLDDTIRESVARKKKWNIEQRNEPKELLDIAGTLRFTRTGYEDKRTGKYIYLLDRILGIEGHQRITLGAAAKILEETILTSYEKGGKAASPTDAASKQAVKELVHTGDSLVNSSNVLACRMGQRLEVLTCPRAAAFVCRVMPAQRCGCQN